MSDQRKYSRERIDVAANFYITGGEFGKIEFTGMIANISESGILIEVIDTPSVEVAKTVAIGSEISFVGIDEYEIFKDRKVEFLEGTVNVVWACERNGKFSIGCEIKNLSRELEKYIADRKIIGFQKRGCILL